MTAEAFGVRFDTAAADKALKQLQKDLDRATMYGLRAAGRVAKQSMKRSAPVYRGKDLRAESGRLKAGIHSSRRLTRRGPNEYRVSVGPWGPVVSLYRSRVDEGEYARAGYEDAAGQMANKFAGAYTRVLQRAGRL